MSRTNDTKLRLQIIGHKQWLLGECVKAGRSFEMNRMQAKAIENQLKHEFTVEAVCRLNVSDSELSCRPKKSHRPKQFSSSNQQRSAVCRYCGHHWPHVKDRTSCPGFGVTNARNKITLQNSVHPRSCVEIQL